jgi:hypothetical protein
LFLHCIHLKDAIEDLIKKGKLSRFTKDGHKERGRGDNRRYRGSNERSRRRSESPRRRHSPRKEESTRKTVDAVSKRKSKYKEDFSSSDDEITKSKGKRPHIASIIGGFPASSKPSKRTMKRRIDEMFAVTTGSIPPPKTTSKRPMLGFTDDEMLNNKPNEMFPLIIMATLDNFDVSRILVDEGSSCDIMYQDLFEKMGLKKESLAPYEGSDLQGFNGAITTPWGLLTLPITFRDPKTDESEITIRVQFLVVPCKSVYNCILGRTTLAALGAVPSTVHLKMKYHGKNDQVVTIWADLVGAKRCHKALKKAVDAELIQRVDVPKQVTPSRSQSMDVTVARFDT